jgi:hypothetical protein
MGYILLSVLFLALLAFLYLQNRQFLDVIRHLTTVLSDLKAFSMGKAEETPKKFIPPIPVEPDFGEGRILSGEEVPPSEEEGF